MAWTEEQLRSTKAGKAFLDGVRRGEEAPLAEIHPPAVTTPLKTRCIVAQTTDEANLNKTERAFYDLLKRNPEAAKVGIQNHTLKLADDTRYTPDFAVLQADGQIVFYETKGFWRDDAKVKIKVAARQFPEYRFVVAVRDKASPTGFKTTPVNP